MIICIEILITENRKKALAIKVAQAATGQDNNKFQQLSISKAAQKRLSI
jgi:hypothetical protein